MSLRNTIALFLLIIGTAAGGVVVTPGSGWQVSRSSPDAPSWSDPNIASLVLYYSGDTNGAGGLVDWSGLGYTGTNTGASIVSVSTNKGRVQYAVNYDGSDDYSQLSPGSLNSCTGNFTISLWTYYDTAAAFEAILSRQYPSVDYSPKMDFTDPPNNYRMYYWRSAVASDLITGPLRVGVPNNTNWVHHTITHTATTNIWYTNGVYCSGAAAAGHQVSSGTITGVVFQLARAGTGANYDGKLTEFRIYTKALSASEALDLSVNSNPLNNNVVRSP